MESPRPVPPSLVLKKGSNKRRSTSQGIPRPVSRTDNTTERRTPAPPKHVPVGHVAVSIHDGPGFGSSANGWERSLVRWAATMWPAGSETFFAGVICEQRVRLRYCEGFWGDVPQCGKRSLSDSVR